MGSGMKEFPLWKNYADSNVKDASRRGQAVGSERVWKTHFFYLR